MHLLSYTSSTLSKVSECTSTVSDRRHIWRLVLPIALLALVLGATLGGIWHHHANAPADTCPICHLSHQAIAPAPASIRVGIPAPEGPDRSPKGITSGPALPSDAFPPAHRPHKQSPFLRAALGTPNLYRPPPRRLTAHAFTTFASSILYRHRSCFVGCLGAISGTASALTPCSGAGSESGIGDRFAG